MTWKNTDVSDWIPNYAGVALEINDRADHRYLVHVRVDVEGQAFIRVTEQENDEFGPVKL